jgi:Fe-S-cluster containining protein
MLEIREYLWTSMVTDILHNWSKKSAERQKHYKQLLLKADAKRLLKILPDLHEEAFSKIDCLSCANCCKNYSPRFKTPDIKRISRHLRLRESEFIERYLRLDEDGDYVVKSTPCPFLGSDNFCSIYEHRPSDCARYPYTNEDVLLKRKQLTLTNSTVCPAVYHVLERIGEITSR